MNSSSRFQTGNRNNGIYFYFAVWNLELEFIMQIWVDKCIAVGFIILYIGGNSPFLGCLSIAVNTELRHGTACDGVRWCLGAGRAENFHDRQRSCAQETSETNEKPPGTQRSIV